MDLEEFTREAHRRKKANRAFIDKLLKRPPRDLDSVFSDAHDEAFAETDCLACANCCKTTSPIFYQRDVDRASKAVRMTPGKFIDAFLRTDEDGDMVLKTAPCAFLLPDNRCSIYADRPTACREYPHTNRKRMHQILDLTYRNTLVCPAVLRIVGKLRDALIL
jgi:Fe-S-cluster containining protein